MKVRANNKEVEIKKGSLAFDLAKKLNIEEKTIGVMINKEIKELSSPLSENDEIKFLNFEDFEGKKIFWHTSAHVLAQAVINLWPEAKPTIGPPIEKGFYYDFANLNISDKDLPKIEKEAKNIIKKNLIPIKKVFKNKEEALLSFPTNKYKKELIEEISEGEITAYIQGEFIDLCKGPHLTNLNKIKSFKILKTAGAYWRGDSKNEMLTRIYAISFPTKEMLEEYLTLLEEAKKRDHKMLGKKLNLFAFKEEAPGMVFLFPNGIYIWNTLLSFLRESLEQANYLEIKTPILLKKDLWEQSGHWFHYKEHMYLSEVEKKEYAIKPMNCPGCMLFYKTNVHSYKELPLRVSEIGHVHRHEPSGALNGLFRVRSFHQDDAHIFMKREDVKDEIINILNLTDKIYMTFGLSFNLELSTRPEKEKTIGTDEDWEITTNALKEALEEWGHSYKINEGEGAFYGPKIDLHIKDALGRSWQCGTIQLDMSLPEKFDLKYISEKQEHKKPLMLHRTILGSIERFLGILIEHFSGNFPFWLNPNPIKIIAVADRHINFSETIRKKIKSHNILCEIDSSNESVSKKIRNAQLLKTNYMITIGDREIENKILTIRTRNGKILEKIKLENFIKEILKEKQEKKLISPYSI
ncbi:MAG: threonyl-tRNA synthetase [Chlamydiae bacterium SM23_39]|nr:MAG: threonyl-tRNA synthetase [Chlamydiae bacterium SM23_39]